MKAIAIKSSLFSCLKTYNKKTFMSDLMAGIIVGIVALPLAIAFGIASGVTPEKGIITAIVAGLIISVFGGSKVQIGGPTGAFIVIIYGIIQKYGMEGLTIATLMAGLFLVLFGLLRLGTIIKYIPYPIVVGFTSGIAVTIFTTQIKDLFGLTLASNPSDFIEKWGVYFQSFDTIDPWCALIGVVSVIVIAITPRFSKKIPGSLIAIILMTIVALILKQYAGVTSIETIGDRFSISNELPAAQVPEINWEAIGINLANGIRKRKMNSKTMAWMIPATGVLPPLLILVIVRAMAPVAVIPPKRGEAILANPCATNSVLES